jgi:DNA-binding transcriptional MerR regulator
MGIAVRRQRQRKPTFTPNAVCQALGITSGTLNSWAYHGWFKGLDAERTTPGRARRFTLEDLIRLAVLKHLVEFGINMERARPLAALCVRYMDEAPIFEFNISFNGNHEEIRLDEDMMSEPASAGALVKLTVYPGEIVKTLKQRLGVAAE